MKEQRIAKRLVAITFSILLLLLIATNILIYFIINLVAERTIGTQGMSTVQNATKYIDTDQYEQFIKNPQEDETYLEIKNDLNEIREHLGALYLYTVAVDQDEVRVVVDGLPEEEDANFNGVTESITREEVEPVLAGKTAFTSIVDDPPNEKSLTAYAPLKNQKGEVIGILGLDISAAKIDDIQMELLKKIIPIAMTVLVIIIIFACILLYWKINASLSPLKAMNKALDDLADGNLKESLQTVQMIEVKKNDEIKSFSDNFNVAVRQLITMTEKVQSSSQSLIEATQSIVESIHSTKRSSQEIATYATHVAESSDAQKRSNEESVQAMQEMTTGVQQIVDSFSVVGQSSQEVTELVDASYQQTESVIIEIDEVKDSVISTNKVIHHLGNQFREIEKIVSVIASITEQTNLLALNAMIESARAGEAGKGFAVVADEVRKLADQSKESAEQIASLIKGFEELTEHVIHDTEESTKRVEAGTESVKSIGQLLHRIKYSISDVHSGIQEVSAVTEEMSAGSEEVLASLEQITEISSRNAEESSMASDSVDEQMAIMTTMAQSAEQLKELSNQLKETVNRFQV